MTTVLQFTVSEIRENGYARFTGPLPAEKFQEALAADAVLTQDVEVDVACSIKDDSVDLTGTIKGVWDLPCSRCLVPGTTVYNAKLDGSFPLSQGTIDGVEEVRQALLLAVPMQFFCKPDCKGLCVKCKKNQNLKECQHA